MRLSTDLAAQLEPGAKRVPTLRRGRVDGDELLTAVGGLWVAGVGSSSVTYRFEMARAGETCVRGEAVAVLLGDDRKPADWPEEYRRLLLSSGPQAPELLVEGEPAAAREGRS